MNNKPLDLFESVSNQTPLQTNVQPEKIIHSEKISSTKKPVSKKGGRVSFKEMDKQILNIQLPEEAFLKQKLYHPIQDVSNWFAVNSSLLRFWEKEFKIIKPRKNNKGDRMYTFEDIKNIELIYYLLRQKKYSIEGARIYIEQHKQALTKQLQQIKFLKDLKSFLEGLKNGIE